MATSRRSELSWLYFVTGGETNGDPTRAAAAIMQAVEADGPPLHFVIGPDAFQRVQAKQERLVAESER